MKIKRSTTRTRWKSHRIIELSPILIHNYDVSAPITYIYGRWSEDGEGGPLGGSFGYEVKPANYRVATG